MTNWVDLVTLKDNLIVYFLGNQLALAAAIFIVAMIILTKLGLDLRYSLTISFPVAGAFFLAGYLQTASADYGWAINLLIIVLGGILGVTMYRIFTSAGG